MNSNRTVTKTSRALCSPLDFYLCFYPYSHTVHCWASEHTSSAAHPGPTPICQPFHEGSTSSPSSHGCVPYLAVKHSGLFFVYRSWVQISDTSDETVGLFCFVVPSPYAKQHTETCSNTKEKGVIWEVFCFTARYAPWLNQIPGYRSFRIKSRTKRFTDCFKILLSSHR